MAKGPMSSMLVTIRMTVRIQESEVRNPHSLDYRKSYQRILMKFYGELGCGRETNCLHFGVDLQIQLPLLPKSITCNFHYLQIHPPLLPKCITCNFSTPDLTPGSWVQIEPWRQRYTSTASRNEIRSGTRSQIRRCTWSYRRALKISRAAAFCTD